MHEVHSPRLGDYLEIHPLSFGQVLMWGEHVIDFAIFKVEVTKLQHCNLILFCSNYVYPFREVRRIQGVFKISRHAILIYCVSYRCNIGG
jgi:hypothetical protein